MTNRDMPAMPSQVSINRDRNEFVPHQFGNDDFVSPGLTKREDAAVKLAASLIARGEQIDGDDICDMAIAIADMLFDKLEAVE